MKTKKINYLTLTVILLGLFACKGSKVAETQQNTQTEQQVVTPAKTNLVKSETTNVQANASGIITKNATQKDSGLNNEQSLKVAEKPIYTYDKSNTITKVTFNNNGVIKEYDVFDYNPFKELKCGDVVSYQEYGDYNYINIKGKEIKDFIKDFRLLPYSKNISEEDSVTSINTLGSFCYNDYSKWYYFIYNAYLFSGKMRVAGMSNVIILDSLGNPYKKIENIGVNIISDGGITSDGKYIVINYGFESESEQVLKEGFRIYNLGKNSLEIDENEGRAAAVQNTLVRASKINIRNDILYKDYVVYDLYAGKKYKKEFLEKDFDEIEFTKEGFVLGRLSGIRKLVSLEKDFKVEDIK